MSALTLLTVEQAQAITASRAGLVLGPSLSMRTDETSLKRDLLAIVTSLCKDEAIVAALGSEDLQTVLDVIANADPTTFELICQQISIYFRESTASFAMEKIARTPWSVVVSLCCDAHAENALRAHLASKPTSRKITVVTRPTVFGLPALLLPVFKLMGSCFDSNEGFRLALSHSDYLIRVHEWQRLLNGANDFLREGGLVFLGTGSSLVKVRDLLSTMLAGRAPFPNYLLFPAGDPAGSDPIVANLAKKKTELYRVDATADQLLDAMAARISTQLTFTFGATDGEYKKHAEFLKYRALAELVPSALPAFTLSSRRQEVLDGLFRPNGTSWDAFLFDLDLPRSQTPEIMSVLTQVNARSDKRLKIVVLRGEAATGKTVVAKRLAVDLRRAGNLVFWCKKTNGDFFHLYRELAKELRGAQAKGPGTSIFMFWDDPYALGIVPVEFAAALDGEGVDITILIVTRNSDKAAEKGFARLPPVDEDLELDFEVTPEEEKLLPTFLVKAGAITNASDASKILGSTIRRNAQDILCRLWYLLPDTREQFEESLNDEYFRLDGVERLIESAVGSTEANGSAARRAYEAVAVISGLGFGIPTEVLVSALHLNYSDWLDECAEGRPIWGLLYPVNQPESDQHLYFTRNELVTQIILRQINGGVGHAAEVRVLRTLVESCTGTTPVYRQFLMELLVRNKDKLRRVVTPNEGKELYELAIRAFPVSDRTLVHHYAKWVSDEVHDNKAAYDILQSALDTPDYPYATHEERREFVHTSMAAIVVQRVKYNEQDRASGLETIKRHIREASTPGFFNLHSVHVQVNALVKLQEGDDPVSLDCFVEACRTLERAQQLAGAQGSKQLRYREALNLLEDQKRVLAGSLANFDKLKEEALEMYEASGNTLLLEAAAIKGLIEASLVDKGSSYNSVWQFLQRCQERVLKRSQPLSLGLRQTRVDLIVRWRLQHDNGQVDWNALLGDIRVLRDVPSRREDILLLFYEAVACFHLRLVADAQAAFVRLRALQIPGPLLSQARIFLRNPAGGLESVQGVMQMKNAGRARVRLTEYSHDVPVYRDRGPKNAQDGATVHCWLSFSLQGPTAEFDVPEASRALLPN